MKKIEKLTKKEIDDITEWDTVNWGKAIKYIESMNLPIKDKYVLELGSRNGGMSLFFGNRGSYCTCTDLICPGEQAERKHKKWGIEGRVRYEALDATSITDKYVEYFDIVTFKSVLGGVGSFESIENEKKMVEEITKVLKRDGYVIFIENMRASKLHDILRKLFRKHGKRWHYQNDENIRNLFSSYMLMGKAYFGFLGLLGWNEKVRKVLGQIDRIGDVLLPNKAKYVGVYIYKKIV